MTCDTGHVVGGEHSLKVSTNHESVNELINLLISYKGILQNSPGYAGPVNK